MSEGRTIPAQFITVAEKRGNHTGVIYLGTHYSYRRIRQMADSFAMAMLEKGLVHNSGSMFVMERPMAR